MSSEIIVLDSSEESDGGKATATASTQQSVKQKFQTTNKENHYKRQPYNHALYINRMILAKKQESWHKGIVIDIVTNETTGKVKYKVRLDAKSDFPSYKILVKPNHLASLEPMSFQLPCAIPLGLRVAANYNGEGIYSGIVAESPNIATNRNRFLIFYDDGYAMYCQTEDVYRVCYQVPNVWEDISSPTMSLFIKDYLENCHNIPKLNVKVNQTLTVEFDGKWHKARCIVVDCNLLQIVYLADKSTEWIYCGSLRLEPLFNINRSKTAQLNSNKKVSVIPRAHTGARKMAVDFIDLTRDTQQQEQRSSEKSHKTFKRKRRNVGVKSTGGMTKTKMESLKKIELNEVNRKTSPAWHRPLKDRFYESNKISPIKPIKTSAMSNSYSELYLGDYDISKDLFKRFSEMEHFNGHKGVFRPMKRPKQDSSVVVISSSSDEDRMYDPVPKNGIKEKSEVFIAKSSSIFKQHKCNRSCVKSIKLDPKCLKGVNPLKWPLICGWTREIAKASGTSKVPLYQIYYRAPCGKLCKHMEDIVRYFGLTNLSELDFDNFCFDSSVRVFCSYSTRPRNYYIYLNDYSDGAEPVPVSCVNEINGEEPPRLKYAITGVPEDDVVINKSKDFMVCCNCTDNCANPLTCPCQNLTVEYAEKMGHDASDVGYKNKRLYNFLQTGNRVVQKGLQHRLQLFRTQKKGWGIRCLDDIPKGAFVCVYVGRIQTDRKANEDGLAAGDEYLAELDHIEVAERMKDLDDENQSSSGVDSDMDDNRFSDTTDSDQEGTMNKSKMNGVHANEHTSKSSAYNYPVMHKKTKHFNKKTPPKPRERKKEDTTDTESDDSSDEMVMKPRPQMAKKTTNYSSNLQSSKLNILTTSMVGEDWEEDDYVSKTRRFYGSMDMFIINAKHEGNLGRYLNHSCAPNLMVQNVFIDTHDLRFPWVAFFTNKAVRAGTELTWDYNYEVGSIPGRIMYCHCGSTKCRKRLL